MLKARAQDIPQEFPDLQKLVEDMYDTMYNAHGVGLAAPRLAKASACLSSTSAPFEEDENKKAVAVEKSLYRPQIIKEEGEEWAFEEGCLSIPGVREDVFRPAVVTIRYVDENWQPHEEVFDGLVARIIQHEYDHIEGILFTDHLSGFKKRLIKSKLTKITRGEVDADYRMKFPGKK